MSENPFGEGFDMNVLLQQAQQMQATLLEAQEDLARARVEGSAGGLVTVTVSGTGELVGVEIKPGAFTADDADSLTDLGDLVVAAYRDAKTKADAEAATAMGPLAGGLGGLGGGDLGGGELGDGSAGGLPGGSSGGGPVGFGV